MLVSLKTVLRKAYKGGYAVGAFNTSNLEVSQAILAAAEELSAPVIIATSESAIKYAGLEVLAGMIRTMAKKVKIPVVLHLDHGRNLEIINAVLKSKLYTSLMVDLSHLVYEENLQKTKMIVKKAKKQKLSVEAELGAIAGVEDYIRSRESFFTDPQQAQEFVKQTGIDALAVSIGTAHGPAKKLNEQKLDLKRLVLINELVKKPLVLHGASQGIPTAHIKKAIKLGISKINIDTDLRFAFSTSLRNLLDRDKIVYDPRKILGIAREAVKNKVKEKIKLFGSAGKA